MTELELTDLDADHQLLELSGTTLLIFTSTGCSSCRWARLHLPDLELPVERLAWIDAGNNGGLVSRYEVFHLPAMFAIKDGQFYGPVQARMNPTALTQALNNALSRPAEELP